MGVWIEIADETVASMLSAVTPCVGVWIEIHPCAAPVDALLVTPCVGVWIEIACWYIIDIYTTSLPAWECGLKLR